MLCNDTDIAWLDAVGGSLLNDEYQRVMFPVLQSIAFWGESLINSFPFSCGYDILVVLYSEDDVQLMNISGLSFSSKMS